MARETDWSRVHPATAGVGTLGILQLVVVLRYPADIDCATAQAWVYVAVLASFVLLGAYGWRAAGRTYSHGDMNSGTVEAMRASPDGPESRP